MQVLNLTKPDTSLELFIVEVELTDLLHRAAGLRLSSKTSNP